MAEVTETARARVNTLAEHWFWPDPAILEDLIALGAESIPAIAERLTPEFFRRIPVEDSASTLLFYFIQVLGELHDPAAIPVLFNLYGEIDEDDDLIQGLPAALSRVGPEAIEPLLRVAADESLGWFPRATAGEAARETAGSDPVLRAQVAAGLREILVRYLTRTEPPGEDDRDVIASLSADLAHLADPEARPLIEAAFDAHLVGNPTGGGLMDIPLIDRAGVEALYARGGTTEFHAPRPYLEQYRQHRREHQESEEKAAQVKLLETNSAPKPLVFSPRLGRNDPCWCGSGQKYKKCHLAQDEKEKSRL